MLFDPGFAEVQTDAFVDSLRVFQIGYSWGGSRSLCLPYQIQAMRDQWREGGQLVRFNIGLEDPGDLISDIEQALGTLASRSC